MCERSQTRARLPQGPIMQPQPPPPQGRGHDDPCVAANLNWRLERLFFFWGGGVRPSVIHHGGNGGQQRRGGGVCRWVGGPTRRLIRVCSRTPVGRASTGRAVVVCRRLGRLRCFGVTRQATQPRRGGGENLGPNASLKIIITYFARAQKLQLDISTLAQYLSFPVKIKT